MQYLLGKYTELVILCSLCSLAAASLCLFLWMHLALLLRNKTTNEVAKYKQISRLAHSLPPTEEEPCLMPETPDAATEVADERKGRRLPVVRRHNSDKKDENSSCDFLKEDGCGTREEKAPLYAKFVSAGKKQRVPGITNSRNEASLHSSLSDGEVKSWFQRMPRLLTAQDATAALTASRALYDRGRLY